MINGLSASDAKVIIKRILPSAIVYLIRAHRNLKPREISIYWRLLFRRALRIRRDRPDRRVASFRSILFVCHGNIIRSPMAAALLRRHLSDLGANAVAISSAGLHANPGQAADARALTVARHFGVSLEHHRAQPLTNELVARTDVIFVMDAINEAKLLARYPGARHKIFMLSAYTAAGELRPIEIADPYDGDEADVRGCYELLQCSIRCLTSTLGFSRT